MKFFKDMVKFHGHACPGLAFGFRVSEVALQHLGARSLDEELVAVVENRSCAVDAIQMMTGCTIGKGNLIINDYGKQVYTFLKRPEGEGVRIAVKWVGLPESPESREMWKRFDRGDRSKEVMRVIKTRKGQKMQAILKADPNELFEIRAINETLPERARVYSSVRCAICGEKVMKPKVRQVAGNMLCIPCAEKKRATNL